MLKKILCWTPYIAFQYDRKIFFFRITTEFKNQLQHHRRLKNPEVDLTLTNAESDINIGRLTHPRRVLGSSEHKDNRFSVYMKQPMCMLPFYCDPTTSGYQIMVHPPQELPFQHQSTKIPLDGQFRIILETTVVAADPPIRNYSPEKYVYLVFHVCNLINLCSCVQASMLFSKRT